MRCSTALLVLIMPATLAAEEPADQIDFTQAVAEVQKLAQQEVERGIVSGVSIALVHDQELLMPPGLNEWDELGAAGREHDSAGCISGLEGLRKANQVLEMIGQ